MQPDTVNDAAFAPNLLHYSEDHEPLHAEVVLLLALRWQACLQTLAAAQQLCQELR